MREDCIRKTNLIERVTVASRSNYTIEDFSMASGTNVGLSEEAGVLKDVNGRSGEKDDSEVTGTYLPAVHTNGSTETTTI